MLHDRLVGGEPHPEWWKHYKGKRWQWYGGGRDKPDDIVFYMSSLAKGLDPFDEERKVRPGLYKKGSPHETDKVIELEPDGKNSFNRTVLEDADNAVWIVEFYSDRCPFCQSLAPEIIKAATQVMETDLPGQVKFGAVNTRVYHEIAEAHGITGYPWIASFYRGKKVEDMAGLGGAESVIRWANKIHGSTWADPPPALHDYCPECDGGDAGGDDEGGCSADGPSEECGGEEDGGEDTDAEADPMGRLTALLNMAVEKGMIPRKRIDSIKKKIASGKRTIKFFEDKWAEKLKDALLNAALKEAGHDEL